MKQTSVMHAIKSKYFDHGLLSFMSGDDYYVRILIRITQLQNGKLLTLVEETPFSSPVDACALDLQQDLEMLWMLPAFKQFPMVNYLLREDAQMNLIPRDLVQLLRPKFSVQGSMH